MNHVTKRVKCSESDQQKVIHTEPMFARADYKNKVQLEMNQCEPCRGSGESTVFWTAGVVWKASSLSESVLLESYIRNSFSKPFES